MNNIIYLVTTIGCYACKCMKNILEEIQKDNKTFTIITEDFRDVPEYISNNIILTDFPTVVFIKNNVIKYHFTGTKSKSKVIKIIEDIKF